MADTRELVDWRVGWARVRPWLGRLDRELAIVAAWVLVLTGGWLLFRFPPGADPDNEHADVPRAGKVEGAQWIHDFHVRAAWVLVLAVGLGAVVLAVEQLRTRRPAALRAVTLAAAVVVLLVVGERSGRGLRWTDYAMDRQDVARDDEGEVVEPGLPQRGVWSELRDHRIDRVETVQGGTPTTTQEVSASHYRGHALAHLVAIPVGLIGALWLLARGRSRSPSWPRSAPSRSRGP